MTRVTADSLQSLLNHGNTNTPHRTMEESHTVERGAAFDSTNRLDAASFLCSEWQVRTPIARRMVPPLSLPRIGPLPSPLATTRPDDVYPLYTSSSLQGEYRAGGRVHTPSQVAPPVGRHQMPQGSSTCYLLTLGDNDQGVAYQPDGSLFTPSVNRDDGCTLLLSSSLTPTDAGGATPTQASAHLRLECDGGACLSIHHAPTLTPNPTLGPTVSTSSPPTLSSSPPTLGAPAESQNSLL